MFDWMFANYLRTSAATAYVIGFILNGVAYMIQVAELKAEWLRLDRESTSHGGWQKLRLKLSNELKVYWVENGATCLGNPDRVLKLQKNKGDSFERFVTEYNGQVWKKSSTPYYKDGDITVNGVKKQIKWETASLTNEKVIREALEWSLKQ